MTASCSPAGLALTPAQHLFTSCGAVVDVASGGSVANIMGIGGDEIWYNPGENRVYYGATAGAIAVVDGNTNWTSGMSPKKTIWAINAL